MLLVETTPAISTIIFKKRGNRGYTESGTFRWDNFEAKYHFELHLDSGFLRLEYEWGTLSKREPIKQEIKLHCRFNYMGYATWKFVCQGKHGRCKKRSRNIYLSEQRIFLCKVCAKVFRGYKARADRIEKYLCRNPDEIGKILNSPYTDPRLKKIALFACDTLQKRLVWMKRRLYNMKLKIYYMGHRKGHIGNMKKNWEAIVKKKIELLLAPRSPSYVYSKQSSHQF